MTMKQMVLHKKMQQGCVSICTYFAAVAFHCVSQKMVKHVYVGTSMILESKHLGLEALGFIKRSSEMKRF